MPALMSRAFLDQLNRNFMERYMSNFPLAHAAVASLEPSATDWTPRQLAEMVLAVVRTNAGRQGWPALRALLDAYWKEQDVIDAIGASDCLPVALEAVEAAARAEIRQHHS